MRFDRLSVLRAMLDVGAVPTFTPLDPDAARRVVCACRDAGAPVIEVMNRAAGTLALFRDLVAWAAVTRIMPTNVEATEDETRSWFAAGAACLGVGPHLISNVLQAAVDSSALTDRVRQYLGWVRAARS